MFYEQYLKIGALVLIVIIFIMVSVQAAKDGFWGGYCGCGRGHQVVNSGPNLRLIGGIRDDPGHETVGYNPYNDQRNHSYKRWRSNCVDHASGEQFMGGPHGPNVWEIGDDVWKAQQNALNAWHLEKGQARAAGHHNAFTEQTLHDNLRQNN